LVPSGWLRLTVLAPSHSEPSVYPEQKRFSGGIPLLVNRRELLVTDEKFCF
jgi:hypothetical protein